MSYAIGVAEPISVSVETFDTGQIANDRIESLVGEYFDLRPGGDYRRPEPAEAHLPAHRRVWPFRAPRGGKAGADLGDDRQGRRLAAGRGVGYSESSLSLKERVQGEGELDAGITFSLATGRKPLHGKRRAQSPPLFVIIAPYAGGTMTAAGGDPVRHRRMAGPDRGGLPTFENVARCARGFVTI